MKLWKLEAKEGQFGRRDKSNPWEPWYDKVFAMIVRAETEQQAREIATENARDEDKAIEGVHPWMDEKYSSCVQVSTEGPAELIMQDIREA